MNQQVSLSLVLRYAAGAVLLGGIGLWLATGAHRGWTKTSTVTSQTDEVTGIVYPVRKAEFVAGVEIPLAATAVAAALAGLSLLPRRRPVVAAV